MYTMRLRIGHLNVWSLVPSVGEVNDILRAYSIDVLCISESWLSQNTASSLLNFPGYELLRKDRSEFYDCGKGGGVCILFRDSDAIQVDTIPTGNPSSGLESLWISISTSYITTAAVVGVIYRPPNAPVIAAIDDLRAQLAQIMSNSKPVYVLGDTNFDLLNTRKKGVRRYMRMIDSLGLKQLVTTITRRASGTLLDHVVVRYSDQLTVAKVELCDVSDHDLVIADTYI